MASNNEKIIDNDDDDVLCQLASTMDDNDVNIYKEEEHCLSQKLSQLLASEDDHQNKQSKDSTTTTMTTTNKRSLLVVVEDTSNISKKMKIDDQKVHSHEEEEEEMKDKIPNYLSINHQNFQQLIQSILSTTANSMNMKDLQEIALLLRQMTMIDLQKSLWNSYLQSGTGQLAKEHRLSTTNHPISVWPAEIKSLIIMNEEKKTKQSEIITTINVKQIDHDTCLNYVYRTLREFINRKIQYQTQLHEKKDSFRHFFTTEMEDAINQFIEQQEMIFIRLEFESKIAIVKYDYQDRLLELEYHQLKPNHYQLHLFENLIQVKQEKEKSQYEVEMLKQRRLHRYLPEPLNSLQLPFPLPPSSISLDTITDQKNRQTLLDHYKKIIEQTKSEMMALYITIAEAKMYECQLKYAQDIVQMRPDQHSTTTEQRLSPSMINIVEQCFKTIDERLQYLYTLKIRFLQEQTKKKTNMPGHR